MKAQGILISLVALVGAGTASAAKGDAAFEKLVDDYFDELPSASPTTATELGIHKHDGELEDLSAAGQARETKRLKTWAGKFSAVSDADLSPPLAADLQLLRASIAAGLLDINGVQGWLHRPDTYTGLASRTIYDIMKRDFAPLADRMKSAISREAKIPALLQQGQRNLVDVPKVSLDIAVEELPGIIDFFRSDVPLAFKAVTDKKLQADFLRVNGTVIRALDEFRTFLRVKIAPKAIDRFAIGEKLFREKLKSEEMVETPLSELLKRGEAELRRLQIEFRATAAQIDSKKSFEDVQKETSKNHPAADKVIATVQGGLAALRQFLIDHKIVSIPSPVLPIVQETPPFMRATTFASMETPGPFEKAKEAYYNVTLPEKSWSPAQVEEFLAGSFNPYIMENVSIHETFPGHYVQFLWVPHITSKVRKYYGANTNVEGWAHYCEQMMIDEGYFNRDPKLKLFQLQDALLRAARFVVGIRMHTRGMSLAQAIEYFQVDGYQPKKTAEMETKRGTEDPTYLYYTLGKLEILKLREDYQKKLGPAYTLQKFHDAFLAEGPLPLPLMRAALIGGETH